MGWNICMGGQIAVTLLEPLRPSYMIVAGSRWFAAYSVDLAAVEGVGPKVFSVFL